LVIFLLLVINLLTFWHYYFYFNKKSVTFENGAKIMVEVADNEYKQEQGLSDKKSIPDNFGLLFPLAGRQPVFWMKEMNFSLDYIWVKNDLIVDIDRQVPIKDAQDNWTSNITAAVDYPDYVIEIKAGFCERNKIDVGQKVFININSNMNACIDKKKFLE